MVPVRVAVKDATFYVNDFSPEHAGEMLNLLNEYGLEHHDGFRYKVKGYPKFVVAPDNLVSLVFDMEEE